MKSKFEIYLENLIAMDTEGWSNVFPAAKEMLLLIKAGYLEVKVLEVEKDGIERSVLQRSKE